MKKFLALILTLVVAMSCFVACTDKTVINNYYDESTENEQEPQEEKQPTDSQYILENGEMVIGMTLFAPMDYKDADGNLTGFEVEFGKAVCEKLGIEANFVEINWNTKETELNRKYIDCIWNAMVITPEVQENMSISIPYMANKQIIVTRKENAEKYAASLEGAKIVAESGSAGEELAKSNEFFKNGEFTAVKDQATALSDVKAGVADVAVVDYVLSIGSIGEGTDYADFVIIEKEEFGSEEYGIAFRKGSDMTEKVNAAIKELVADGTLAKIAEKYKLQDVLLVD